MGVIWEGEGGLCVENGDCFFTFAGESKLCLPCLQGRQRPNSTEFGEYISTFLNTNPSQECAAGGHAAFSSAVKLEADNKTVNSESICSLTSLSMWHSQHSLVPRLSLLSGESLGTRLLAIPFPTFSGPLL